MGNCVSCDKGPLVRQPSFDVSLDHAVSSSPSPQQNRLSLLGKVSRSQVSQASSVTSPTSLLVAAKLQQCQASSAALKSAVASLPDASIRKLFKNSIIVCDYTVEWLSAEAMHVTAIEAFVAAQAVGVQAAAVRQLVDWGCLLSLQHVLKTVDAAVSELWRVMSSSSASQQDALTIVRKSIHHRAAASTGLDAPAMHALILSWVNVTGLHVRPRPDVLCLERLRPSSARQDPPVAHAAQRWLHERMLAALHQQCGVAVSPSTSNSRRLSSSTSICDNPSSSLDRILVRMDRQIALFAMGTGSVPASVIHHMTLRSLVAGLFIYAELAPAASITAALECGLKSAKASGVKLDGVRHVDSALEMLQQHSAELQARLVLLTRACVALDLITGTPTMTAAHCTEAAAAAAGQQPQGGPKAREIVYVGALALSFPPHMPLEDCFVSMLAISAASGRLNHSSSSSLQSALASLKRSFYTEMAGSEEEGTGSTFDVTGNAVDDDVFHTARSPPAMTSPCNTESTGSRLAGPNACDAECASLDGMKLLSVGGAAVNARLMLAYFDTVAGGAVAPANGGGVGVAAAPAHGIARGCPKPQQKPQYRSLQQHDADWLARGLDPLLGRTEELQNAMGHVNAGEALTVVLGVSGMGTSHLLRWLSYDLVQRGTWTAAMRVGIAPGTDLVDAIANAMNCCIPGCASEEQRVRRAGIALTAYAGSHPGIIIDDVESLDRVTTISRMLRKLRVTCSRAQVVIGLRSNVKVLPPLVGSALPAVVTLRALNEVAAASMTKHVIGKVVHQLLGGGPSSVSRAFEERAVEIARSLMSYCRGVPRIVHELSLAAVRTTVALEPDDTAATLAMRLADLERSSFAPMTTSFIVRQLVWELSQFEVLTPEYGSDQETLGPPGTLPKRAAEAGPGHPDSLLLTPLGQFAQAAEMHAAGHSLSARGRASRIAPALLLQIVALQKNHSDAESVQAAAWFFRALTNAPVVALLPRAVVERLVVALQGYNKATSETGAYLRASLAWLLLAQGRSQEAWRITEDLGEFASVSAAACFALKHSRAIAQARSCSSMSNSARLLAARAVYDAMTALDRAIEEANTAPRVLDDAAAKVLDASGCVHCPDPSFSPAMAARHRALLLLEASRVHQSLKHCAAAPALAKCALALCDVLGTSLETTLGPHPSSSTRRATVLSMALHAADAVSGTFRQLSSGASLTVHNPAVAKEILSIAGTGDGAIPPAMAMLATMDILSPLRPRWSLGDPTPALQCLVSSTRTAQVACEHIAYLSTDAATFATWSATAMCLQSSAGARLFAPVTCGHAPPPLPVVEQAVAFALYACSDVPVSQVVDLAHALQVIHAPDNPISPPSSNQTLPPANDYAPPSHALLHAAAMLISGGAAEVDALLLVDDIMELLRRGAQLKPEVLGALKEYQSVCTAEQARHVAALRRSNVGAQVSGPSRSSAIALSSILSSGMSLPSGSSTLRTTALTTPPDTTVLVSSTAPAEQMSLSNKNHLDAPAGRVVIETGSDPRASAQKAWPFPKGLFSTADLFGPRRHGKPKSDDPSNFTFPLTSLLASTNASHDWLQSSVVPGAAPARGIDGLQDSMNGRKTLTLSSDSNLQRVSPSAGLPPRNSAADASLVSSPAVTSNLSVVVNSHGLPVACLKNQPRLRRTAFLSTFDSLLTQRSDLYASQLTTGGLSETQDPSGLDCLSPPTDLGVVEERLGGHAPTDEAAAGRDEVNNVDLVQDLSAMAAQRLMAPPVTTGAVVRGLPHERRGLGRASTGARHSRKAAAAATVLPLKRASMRAITAFDLTMSTCEEPAVSMSRTVTSGSVKPLITTIDALVGTSEADASSSVASSQLRSIAHSRAGSFNASASCRSDSCTPSSRHSPLRARDEDDAMRSSGSASVTHRRGRHQRALSETTPSKFMSRAKDSTPWTLNGSLSGVRSLPQSRDHMDEVCAPLRPVLARSSGPQEHTPLLPRQHLLRERYRRVFIANARSVESADDELGCSEGPEGASHSVGSQVLQSISLVQEHERPRSAPRPGPPRSATPGSRSSGSLLEGPATPGAEDRGPSGGPAETPSADESATPHDNGDADDAATPAATSSKHVEADRARDALHGWETRAPSVRAAGSDDALQHGPIPPVHLERVVSEQLARALCKHASSAARSSRPSSSDFCAATPSRDGGHLGSSGYGDISIDLDLTDPESTSGNPLRKSRENSGDATLSLPLPTTSLGLGCVPEEDTRNNVNWVSNTVAVQVVDMIDNAMWLDDGLGQTTNSEWDGA